MYLARLEVEDYRVFGSQASGKHLVLDLQPGLNLLLGENDSGKTCVVDAIRLILGTSPTDHFYALPEDFHSENGLRAKTFRITAYLRDLSEQEAAGFLEYLSIEANNGKAEYVLRVSLRAEMDESFSRSSRRSPVRCEWRAGSDDEGHRFEGPARELLRATYLRPLRDAIAELTAKRGSRLAQILHSYPDLKDQVVDDFNPDDPASEPQTLTGVMRQAEHKIRNSPVVKEAETKMNESYLQPFSIGPKPLKGQIGIPRQELRQILERLELTLADQEPGATRGLGVHNVLFMGAELLAVERADDPCLPLVLIEEPEAHLHPQLQLRLVEFFHREAEAGGAGQRLQIVLTSHSPNIASKVGLQHVTLMNEGRAFSLRPSDTKLDASDYDFLERFLDVTRADLFFARGLLIVEGDAEAILLPALAGILGCPLSKHGVSVINVGSRGLFRYSRIFQRHDGRTLPVRVACLADRDLPPDEAKPLLPAQRQTEGDLTPPQREQLLADLKSEDGGAVRTFPSEHWTLEYDLARCGLARAVHVAVTLAKASKARKRALSRAEQRGCLRAAACEYEAWKNQGKTETQIALEIYAPLLHKQASKTETAQYLARLLRRTPESARDALSEKLPSYIREAICYTTNQQPAAAATPAATIGAALATA